MDEIHYPGSAYPLFLSEVYNDFKYIQIDEKSGEILGSMKLIRNDDKIIEYKDGKIQREFIMKGEFPIQIN